MKLKYNTYYKAWFTSFFGGLCLHRKLLNKPISKARKLSFNFLILGGIIDLFFIKKWVGEINNIAELKQLEKDLKTLQHLKNKLVKEQNFESAKWYRDKEVLLIEKIKKLKN